MNNHLPIAPELLIPLAAFAALIVLLLAIGKVPLSYNLRNLAVRWKTTLVTALAFTLVVGLLTIMMAFVAGMDKLTQESGIPGNVTTLADGATDEAQSSLTADYSIKVLPQDLKREVLQDQQGRYLSSREIYAVVNQPIPNAAPGGRQRRFVQVRGLEDPAIAAAVHNMELYSPGKWFPHDGYQQRTRTVDGKTTSQTLYEVVVGEGLSRDLGGDFGKAALEVGDTFELGPVTVVVVGIMKSEGTTFGSEIWTTSAWVGQRFNKNNTFSSITSRTHDAASADKAAALVRNHKEGAATALPETEYYSKMTMTNLQFRIAAVFIGIIMAIGGVLGVMNTMFAAISQRTKDIGVLRILGYSRKALLVSFLLESLFIALLGGLVGCGLGYLTNGLSATSTLSSVGGGGGKSVMLRLVVDGNTFAAGMLFTLVMGTLGGLVPSLSAMRLKPLESLR
jgi:ABC-type lipoprotein release transport system permease subunit